MNDRALVAQMVAHMEGHLVEPISAEGLAAHAGYSINRLRQKFFHVTGDTPSGYLRKRRLTEAAKEILGGARLVDVGLKYGYSSQENFTTAFRSYFGITPSELARIQGKYKRFIRRMREAYSLMEIASLNQPPLNATLMGCMKGAADYFDLDLSAAMLYGLSGHAFLINIHRDLHPSSPYVWKKTHFRRLLAGVSIDTVEEFELSKSMPEPERRTIEERMKSRLNEGQLCMLDYLEHQLISGYDEAGFLTLRPWDGHAPSEVPQIAFGSWSPCLEREGWAHVTVLAGKRPPKPIESSLKDALAFAVELSSNPKDVEVEGYRIGAAAYDAWMAAVERGLGSSRGHWWNAMVWSECRAQAATFFRELAEILDDVSALRICEELQRLYSVASSALDTAKEKSLQKSEQLCLLHQAQDADVAAQGWLEKLRDAV